MVPRAGFKKKLRLYFELKIYDKNRRKITGPQCVNTLNKLLFIDDSVCSNIRIPLEKPCVHEITRYYIFIYCREHY
jgi:hypothetical protein